MFFHLDKSFYFKSRFHSSLKKHITFQKFQMNKYLTILSIALASRSVSQRTFELCCVTNYPFFSPS